ncbi:MAG: ferredoxin [Kineosporiaceae bacterium]
MTSADRPADATGPQTVMIPLIEATGAIPLPGDVISAPARRARQGKRLRVDWPACKGHKLCAELVPERITLDEWGYPIIDSRPLRGAALDHAKKAVKACPTLALRLVDIVAK